MNKEFKRIEAKLDAILKALKVKPEDYEAPTPAAQAAPKLSAAEQQAIDNAPKPTPPPVVDVAPRVTATNAPSVASSTPKANAKKD
jgi:TRAP-type uncharacterized transport system substrate-binding protein